MVFFIWAVLLWANLCHMMMPFVVILITLGGDCMIQAFELGLNEEAE